MVRVHAGAVRVGLCQPGGSRSRPRGVVGYELSFVDGANPPVEGEADRGSKCLVTRSLVTVPMEKLGLARARLYARHFTGRGEYGPWSLPVTFSAPN